MVKFEMVRFYGCTRSQLDEEDFLGVMLDYTLLQTERKVLAAQRRIGE